ncbi:unnamed protein product, partial [marine sediment metagenome]
YLESMRLFFVVSAGTMDAPLPPASDPRAVTVPMTLHDFFDGESQTVDVAANPVLPMHVRATPTDDYATRPAIFDSGSTVNFVSESFAIEAGIDTNSAPDLTITVGGVGDEVVTRYGWYVDALALELGAGREGEKLLITNTAVFVIPDEQMPGELQAILGSGVFGPGTTDPLSWPEDTPVLEWFVDLRTDEPALVIVLATDGDANFDSVVDYIDLGILASHYDGSGRWGDGDFNGDFVVDYIDLGMLAGTYGVGVADAPAPEPA